MIHNLFYSSGDKVSFDDTDINSRVSNQFQTEYVELSDGRREMVGYFEDIAFFEGYSEDETNWYQVSEEDDFALEFAKPVWMDSIFE